MLKVGQVFGEDQNVRISVMRSICHQAFNPPLVKNVIAVWSMARSRINSQV